ncbi:STE2 [Candida oxycetoniae]|uniref:STE2 n=1 Tax=Candida oxycetoniae TaxID=497107 RepID=A0AAI9WZC5_9ASCO|nr:STE2 [Candida oxycetoniae]KAI3406053.2 STE2 [Candida oxycetoniae]
MRGAIILGVTIGACTMLLIFLLGILYNNRKKLKTSVLFNLNIWILIATIIRSGCYLNYYMNDLASVSFNFTGVYHGESFASSNAANAFKTIMFALVELSLTYQIYVIFRSTTLKNWGIAATILAGLLSLASVATQIWSSVLAHKNFKASTKGLYVSGAWMDLPTILFAVSINIMSLLLLFKLGIAIKTRRYLGLRQFDGFHILFIMSTQTLIIPSILLFVHYFLTSNSGPDLINVALLLVVIFLPLSSLWAQTANNVRRIDSSPSMSFISRESSNSSSGSSGGGGGGGSSGDALRQASKISRFNTYNSSTTSPTTLRDDSSYVTEKIVNQPISGIDANLPCDLEKYLFDDSNNEGDGMIAREVTILKT